MDNASHTSCRLTHSDLAALKKSYEQCTDRVAKETILAACQAIIRLHHDLGTHDSTGCVSEGDCDFDPSEYCAAV
jgi:hypothetical protein